MESSLLLHIITYIVSFSLVWIGAGLVVSAVSELAKSWKLPAFFLSFFLLGILTSLPEITIGSIAILNDDPVIMVGNLLGGVIVMFLGVIPLLGLVGGGVRMPSQLNRKQLLFTLLVVVAPAFLSADQKLEKWEAIFLILLYLSLFLIFSLRQSLWEKIKSGLVTNRRNGLSVLLKVTLGICLLIGASNQIVSSTLFFADLFSISPFFISLIVVALGTNIPEISIIFRTILSKKKDIAFADYLGSASANTMLIGVFTILYGKTIQLPNHFFQRFAFLAVGLLLFYFFSGTKNNLSRKESLVLLGLYLSFILFELYFNTQLS